MKYGDYLEYVQIDEDEDGTYDYVEITDCDQSVTEVEIPGEIDGLPVASIGDSAFEFCRELENITIPDSVKSICSYAFSNCKSLNNVMIPEGVKAIEYGAFYDCTNLLNINIPQSIESLGYRVFENTLVTSGQTGIVCLDNWIIDVTDNTITEAVIPDGIYGICSGAFSWCEELTDVTIPESVSIIGDYAFGDPSTETSNDGRDGLKNLKNVEIQGNGLTYIGKNAFAGDISLEEINLPDSLETISYCAFSYSGIIDIVIPKNVKSIGDWSFRGCSSLTSMTILNPECEIYDSGLTISNGYTFENGIYYFGIIYGFENSTAQAYAEKYERNFVSLGEKPVVTTPAVTTAITTTQTTVTTTTAEATKAQETTAVTTTIPTVTTAVTTTTVSETVKGDASGDGKLNIRDAAFIARKLVEKKVNELPDCADFNGDGTVNIRDAAAIARYLVNHSS